MGRLESRRFAHGGHGSSRSGDSGSCPEETVMVCLKGVPRSYVALAVLSWGLLALVGCSVGPKYSPPTTQIPPAYKENANWKTAQPSDQAQKGNWWEIFQDPQLNALEEKVNVSNQTLRAAADRFQEARAALRQTRSALFPLVTASVSPTQNRQSQHKATFGATAPVNYSDLNLSG